MKSRLLQSLLMAILIIAFVFSGCKKDEETNYLTIGDTTVVLSDGGLKYYGEYGTSTFNFDIYLFSPEVTITEQSDNWYYSDAGSCIYFESMSSSSTVLSDGSYTYVDNDEYPAFTYDYGDYKVDMSLSGDWIEFDSGTLTVKKTDDGYSFDFTGEDVNGVAIKFNYTGSMHYADRSSTKKK